MRTRTYSKLRRLWEKHGAHEFGKICQILLGVCLLQLKFRIQIFQLSGRPDIVAVRNNGNYAFEVKTQSDTKATIKPDDLEGVKEYPEQGILAVLSYPDLDCNWVLVKADDIRPGKWPIQFLKQHSIPLLEQEINKVFPQVLEEYFAAADIGTSVLYQAFNDEWGMEKKKSI